jgi:hypothetical protein
MQVIIYKSDAEFVEQMNTAGGKVDDYTSVLSLTVPEKDGVKNDAAYCEYVLECCNIFDAYSQELNKYKDILFGKIKGEPLGSFPTIPTLTAAPTAVAADVRKRFADFIQNQKRKSAFNESIAEGLGVLAPENPSNPDTAKPKVTGIVALPDRVKTFFLKEGWFAVRGYMSYDGTNWVKGDIDPTSPYEDLRPNQTSGTPETRHFKFRFVNTKGEEVGLESDVVKVVTAIYAP